MIETPTHNFQTPERTQNPQDESMAGREAGMPTRPTGLACYWEHHGTGEGAQPEDVQKAAGHRDLSTTKLCDRRATNQRRLPAFSQPSDSTISHTV